MKVEITKHDDIVIDGEQVGFYTDSIVRCCNKDCDDFGQIGLAERPDVCCDGPFAIYTLLRVEDDKGHVFANASQQTALSSTRAQLERAAQDVMTASLLLDTTPPEFPGTIERRREKLTRACTALRNLLSQQHEADHG